MADYLYTTHGSPQGFRIGAFIYAMDGTPLGRVFAEKAYRLDGAYVGAVINNMVLDRPGISRRDLPAHPAPPRAAPPLNADQRRPVAEAYADCFDRLFEAETPDDAAASSAAAE